MKLETLQSLLTQAFTGESKQYPTSVLSQVIGAQTLTSVQGLQIYQGSITSQLCRTLQRIYPVCDRLVGPDFFWAMAQKYVPRSVSHSPDLGDYGAGFPEFLATFPPVADLPYLPDVGRLEWYWHRVFNSDRQPPLDLQALSAIPQTRWGEIIFYLPRNSVLLNSPYPVHRIWQVNQTDYQGEETIDLNTDGSQILLWRRALEMRIDLPNAIEWQLLQALRSPQPLGTICDQLVQQDSGIDVGALLPIFVQRGWIADFSLPT